MWRFSDYPQNFHPHLWSFLFQASLSQNLFNHHYILTCMVTLSRHIFVNSTLLFFAPCIGGDTRVTQHVYCYLSYLTCPDKSHNCPSLLPPPFTISTTVSTIIMLILFKQSILQSSKHLSDIKCFTVMNFNKTQIEHALPARLQKFTYNLSEKYSLDEKKFWTTFASPI